MLVSGSRAWQIDWLKLQSIVGKFFRGLITAGVFTSVVMVLSNTIIPELKETSPLLATIVGIILTELIEILNKLKKDYSNTPIINQ